MNKLKYTLIGLMMSLQAMIVDSQAVTSVLTLKGDVSTYQVESIQLPFNAKISPLKPYGQLVEKGEAIFHIGYFSQTDSIAHQIYGYIQQEKRLLLEAKHIQTLDELMEIGAVSQKEYIKDRLNFEEKQSKLLEDQIALKNLLAPYQVSIEDLRSLENQSLDSINDYIEKHIPNVIYAPSAGILLPGKDEHTDMFTKFTPIAKIANPHALQINAIVSEKQLAILKEGLPMEIKIPSLNQSFEGVVHTVNRYPNTNQKYSVSIRFTNLDQTTAQNIILGMKCILNIRIEEKDSLLIPLSAVKEMDGKTLVMVGKNGKFSHIQEIQVGNTHGMNIEVISGLQPGEEVLENN